MRPKNPRYEFQGIRGYYYLVNLDTGRGTNTGYDTCDYPWQEDGQPHPFICQKYRRALSLESQIK